VNSRSTGSADRDFAAELFPDEKKTCIPQPVNCNSDEANTSAVPEAAKGNAKLAELAVRSCFY
jgi:hypothetical protein